MIDEALMFRIADLCKSPKYKLTPDVLAYHEAGHAIVQRALGMTLKKTAINRNKLIGISITCISKKSDPKKHNDPETLPLEIKRLIYARRAAISRAGEIAERIFVNKTVKGVVLTGSADDMKARHNLVKVGLSALSVYPDRLAKKILNSNWEEVERVANRLLETGVINWNELNECHTSAYLKQDAAR